MSRRPIPRLLTLASLLLFAITSCNSGPATVKQPSINASSAGKLAMEQYDKNGDGIVSGAELDQAPGLKAALKNLDTNGDGGVSADEVAARVNAWKAMQSGITMVRMYFTLDGQPLSGAEIILEPESFLGDEVKKATSVTDQFGGAMPVMAPEDRPSPKAGVGVQFGLFKLRVSKVVNGKETIPARYNSATTLGQEVSYDDPGMKAQRIAFALKSK